MNKDIVNDNKRVIYIDTLRCLAVFGIIILHLSAKNWYYVNINSYEWNIFNIYDSSVRCFVPIFVMISGALILEKKYFIKEIYLKKVLRMVLSFIFWSIIYAIVFYYDNGIKVIIIQSLTGHFHLWFLFMISGLYMLVPFLKKIVEHEQITKYFLIIVFTFQTFLLQVIMLLNTFHQEEIANIINNHYGNVQMLFGYSGYFVLGYYIRNKDYTKKHRKIIYLFGIIGILSTILLTILESNQHKIPMGTYYNYFSLNVAIVAFALFVFAKYNFKESKICRNLSKKCFGIYLVHVLVYEMIYKYLNIDSLSFNPLLSIPLLSIFTFIISLAITKCIILIPKINKYII